MKKTITLFLSVLFVLSLTPSVMAGEESTVSPSFEDILGDVLVIRPLGVIRVVLEAAAFGISYPVTRHLKKVEEASEFLLRDPQSFTFERPLGEM